MTIEHSDIGAGEIHEPKGVSTATIGQTYVADGLGSGSWENKTASNQILIQALADLPTPAAGVITLADDTVYIIAGNVDIGANRLVLGNETYIQGTARDIDVITSSTSGALFTGTANNRIHTLGISAASGSLVSYNGGGTNTLFIENINVVTVGSLGTITDSLLTVIRFSNYNNTVTDGYTFTGSSNGKLVISNATFTNTNGTAIDLGTAVFTSIFIGPQTTVITPSGQTGLAVAANSANFGATGRGVIANNVFNGAGTHSTGLAVDDLKWEVFLNFGLKNSEAGAQGSISGSALNTTFGGTSTPVKANFGTAFVADVQNKVAIDNTGRMTYLGLVDELFFFDATLFGSVAGGAAREYNYYLAKNGSVITSSVSKTSYDGSTPGSNSVSCIVELDTNDYLEVWVEALTATTNLNIETASLKVFGVI